MKKILFFALAMMLSIAAFSQTQEIRKNKKKSGLSPHELVLQTKFFIPQIRYNYYINEKTIYHLDEFKLGIFQGENKKIGTSQWLEFRHGNRLFFGHGPTLGVYGLREVTDAIDNPVEWSPYVTAGYSVGVGGKLGKRITVGTRFNPYIELTEGDFGVKGTNPLQVFTNLYAAFRF